MVFPIMTPPDPQGPWREQSWIYIILESFHVNMTYSGSVVLEKKIFKWLHPIFAFLRLSPLWRRPGPLFEQFRISFTQGWFIPSLIARKDLSSRNAHLVHQIWYIVLLLHSHPCAVKANLRFNFVKHQAKDKLQLYLWCHYCSY